MSAKKTTHIDTIRDHLADGAAREVFDAIFDRVQDIGKADAAYAAAVETKQSTLTALMVSAKSAQGNLEAFNSAYEGINIAFNVNADGCATKAKCLESKVAAKERAKILKRARDTFGLDLASTRKLYKLPITVSSNISRIRNMVKATSDKGLPIHPEGRSTEKNPLPVIGNVKLDASEVFKDDKGKDRTFAKANEVVMTSLEQVRQEYADTLNKNKRESDPAYAAREDYYETVASLRDVVRDSSIADETNIRVLIAMVNGIIEVAQRMHKGETISPATGAAELAHILGADLVARDASAQQALAAAS